MNKITLIHLLATISFGQNFAPVDILVTMNGTSAGTTVSNTNLATGTVGTFTNWTNACSHETFGASQVSLPAGVQVNGGSYYAAGTAMQSIAYNNGSGSGDCQSKLNFTGSSQHALAITGFLIPGPPNLHPSGNTYDLLQFNLNSGHDVWMQLKNGNPGYQLQIEGNGGSASSTSVALSQNGTYWYSMLVDTVNDVAELNVYNTSFQQIGSTVVMAITNFSGAETFNGVWIGNGQSGADGGTTYFQYVMIDYTNGAWPNIPQLWNGIIAPTRAAHWQNAGVTGGIPTNRTQCTNTQCAAVTSAGASATVSQINSALANAPANTYVLLPAGTYSLSAGVSFPQGGGNVTLRGAGADQTDLQFSAGSLCPNSSGTTAAVCMSSSDINWKSGMSNGPFAVTGVLTQGTATITLASVPNLKVGNPIILMQLDTGLTGTTCSGASGTVTDNGAIVVTDSASTGTGVSPGLTGPYSTQGNSGGPMPENCQQAQVVIVTQCDGNTTSGHSCSSGTAVTISSGLYMPNWYTGTGVQAWWATSPGTGFGLENLTIDSTAITGNPNSVGVEIFNVTNSWVKGIRSIDTALSHIDPQYSTNITIRDSYFFLTQNMVTSSYGLILHACSDTLVENNIFQAIASPVMADGPGPGSVIDYNFMINNFYLSQGYNQNAHGDHTAGVGMELYEGNNWNVENADVVHGTHQFQTHFRERMTGPSPECYSTGASYSTATYTACNSNLFPINNSSFSRFYNIIGNILGTTGTNTTYSNSGTWPVYYLGHGNGSVPTDANVATTQMLWGNVDSATGFTTPRWCGNSSDTGWSTTCSLTTEIPLGSNLSTSQVPYANPVPVFGDTGAGQGALPASFYYASTPSWWPASKAWPVAGPDVTGGNVSGVNGTAYSIPAEDCFLNVMGGNSNGTGGPYTFNANTCYYGGSIPSGGIRVGPTVRAGPTIKQ